MASVKIIREEPKPAIPPIKEVVLTLSEEEAMYLLRLTGHHVCGGSFKDGKEANNLRSLNSWIWESLYHGLGHPYNSPLPIDNSERTDALFLRSTP